MRAQVDLGYFAEGIFEEAPHALTHLSSQTVGNYVVQIR